MVTNCLNCPFRKDCNNCDKEMTCEEFKAYMQKKEQAFFEQYLTECDKESTLRT